ncbi:hypothetical protein [Blastochloris sulfoviridis]|uniref:Uncharacterized protein n=1 Tax=Blastochloris sulfoviridis TaxID=50712 RepID=A0A5M6I249_9HYPH|nr:hypothetical protein [Blastochloris sulfoviridis]KAA5602274.1 hypothetical protein F1193_06530 [Blastochloris sulfoviridis]
MTTLGRLLTLLAVPLALAVPLGLAGAAVAETVAEGSRCPGIADAAERLRCFDAESAKGAQADKPATNMPAAPAGSGPAGWVLERRRDPLTDGVACVISPPGRPDVRVGREEMVVRFGQRGGVARYRFRLDNSEPSRVRTLPRRDRAVQQVRFRGKVFDRILMGRRLVLEVTTFGAGVVVEEFDLAGLSAEHDRLLRECP